VQRGGALEDITFSLAKLDFLISIYDNKLGVMTRLNRLKKVLEIGKTINNKTVDELEDANQKLIGWRKVEVDWKSAEGVIDVAKQTTGLENIKTELMGDAISDTADLAGGTMLLHQEGSNTTGFESNVNNVAIAAKDLFNTLLRGPYASAKRSEFLEHFGSNTWQCVDATIDDIHAFNFDEGSVILLSKPVLDNFSKIIKKIVKKICEDQTYFRLEKEYFLYLLIIDNDLREYFRKYRGNEAVAGEIQKKVVNEGLAGIINKDQEEDEIIKKLFNHSIGLSTISTVDIGTTTFVVGCVDETKADSDDVFVNKVKEKEQTLTYLDMYRDPSLLTKLNTVYSDTLIRYDDNTTSKCRVSDLDIDGRTFTCEGDATQKRIHDINAVTFSNPKPAAGGAPEVGEVVGGGGGGGGGGAPANVAEGAEVAEAGGGGGGAEAEVPPHAQVAAM
jgi:hypothetical protein